MSTSGEEGGAGAPPVSGSLGPLSKMNEDDNNNMERSLFQFEYSKLPLEDLLKEWNARVHRRAEVFEKNGNVQHVEFEMLVKQKKLDSNLKKCTAFVRKMRQFQESYKSSLESDIRTLNLTKYISEITMVIVNLKLKSTDISSLVSVCSEIHKRYRDFSSQLLESFGKVLMVSELVPSTKLSTDIRLFIELLLAGIFNKEEAITLLLSTVQNLVSLDKDGSQLIPMMITLLRDVTDELIGTIPRDIRLALADHVCESQLVRGKDLALNADEKAKLRGVLKKYFHLVKTIFVKKNDKVWGSAKYLRKMLETKGEIPPDRQKSHDKLASELDKYHHNLAKLANLLDVQTPKLRYLSTNPDDDLDEMLGAAGDDGEAIADDFPMFDDEETKQFYQDLPDLVAYMFEKKNGFLKPRAGFDQGSEDLNEKSESEAEKRSASGEEDSSSDEDSNSSVDIEDLVSDTGDESDSEFEDFDAELEKADLMREEEELSTDEEEDALPSVKDAPPDEESVSGGYSHEDISVSSGQSKVNFHSYLSSLKNCVNKAMIDKAAYEFVNNFKSKRCRAELAKHLFTIPRQRMDLLRLFSRLAATLSQIYPDIGHEICELLRKDFRHLVLKRDQQRLEPKLRVTRFIAELTIFSVFSKSEAFNCLKMLLRNFSHHQIEMTCCFLETCGRFLYKSRDSHRRMKLYLDELMRRKTVQFLESSYAYKVDCAYNHVCPPRGGPAPKKVRSALQAFMEFVLVKDLSRDTLEKAVKILRMFDWRDHVKTEMVVGVLSAPWKLNYSQLDTAAALLASLKQFRPSVTNAVIENISEVIRLGCEFESEDINNLRMSTCQYFAHLYNYKCISTTSLLNVMYYLISYGVTYQNTVFSTMDPPDSLYRIRVICHMLKIVGEFVSTPKSNRRLDFFLKYFQRYYLYKRGLSVWAENSGRKRFPHYVEEMFEDTIKRVRDKWTFVKTMEEAEQDILELDKRLRERVKNDQVKRAMSGERNAVGVKVNAVNKTKLEEKTKPVNYAKAATANVVPQPQKSETEVKRSGSKELAVLEEVSEEEDEDEFEKQFRAMCVADSLSTHSEKVVATRKAAVPAAKLPSNGESGMNALSFGFPKVKVTVLTKQNNKPKEKTLEIETKEDFLMSIKEREEKEKREMQEVKTRTLQLSRKQQEEEQLEKERSMMDALLKFGKVATRNPGKRAHQHSKKSNPVDIKK